MNSPLRVLTRLGAALAVVLGLMVATPAAADPLEDVIRELDIHYQVQPDGQVLVTETYTWDFGDRDGLGFTRELPTEFEYERDHRFLRIYDYDDFALTSPSGAPAELWVYDRGSYLRIDAGAPDGSDDTRSGVQVYELNYTISGALNPIRDEEGVPDQDEFYWNATGHDWRIPIEQVTVEVSGPADVVDAACYRGGLGSDERCPELATDGATMTAGDTQTLRPYQGLTIMAAFPADTFADIEPTLERKPLRPSDDVITDLDIRHDIDASGLIHVTETYTWDFAEREADGFDRRLSNISSVYAPNGYNRHYTYTDISVSSPTGAPSDLHVDDDGRRTDIQIGHSGITSGTQTYVLRYTIDGMIHRASGPTANDVDQIPWSVSQRNPIEALTVTLNTPVEPVELTCRDPNDLDGCSFEGTGTSLTAQARDMSSHQSFQVRARFPAGTFAGGENLVRQPTNPPPAFWGGVLGAAGLAGAFGWWRRRSRTDLHYPGLTPGAMPAGAGQDVAPLRSDPAVAVRFTPPDDLAPAEVAELMGKRRRGPQLAATIVSLAAGGYLTITPSGSEGSWRLAEVEKDGELRRFEATMLRGLFSGRKSTTISRNSTHLSKTMKSVAKQIDDAVDDRELFTTKGAKPRWPWVMMMVFGAFSTAVCWGMLGDVAAPSTPYLQGGIALALALTAVGLAGVLSGGKRQRSATGRALYEQARGFELYLRTVKADQLRWEEGEDIFSRYLPYAIVFGVAERWAALFAELAAEGKYPMQATWYVHGLDRSVADIATFSGSISSMSTTLASASVANPSTPGSSGSSGSFSGGGGGGFSGGGGGGGGGGGR